MPNHQTSVVFKHVLSITKAPYKPNEGCTADQESELAIVLNNYPNAFIGHYLNK